MNVKFKKFLALASLICLVCVGVVIFSEVTGLRQKAEAQRLQAEAERLQAQAVRERQLPLIVASLVDTLMAVFYAISDRLLLIASTIYIIIMLSAKEGEDHEEEA